MLSHLTKLKKSKLKAFFQKITPYFQRSYKHLTKYYLLNK